MEILFEIISHHKFFPQGRISHIFNESGGYIGRSNESDWVLPDRFREISRKHALISCDGKNFFLEDLSSNGVMSTLTQEMVGAGQRHLIQHGDSFQLGQFVIQARLLRNPNSYLPVDLEGTVIENDQDLDPLVAMERQELREVRDGLGFYDDLVAPKNSQPPSYADSLPDHNQAELNAMLSVRGIPEDWEADQPDLVALGLEPRAQEPELWLHSPQDNSGPASGPQAATPVIDFIPGQGPGAQNSGPRLAPDFEPSSEVDLFFKTLGVDLEGASSEERKKLLILAAELLRASIDGLTSSLQNRAASQKELRLPITTIEVSGNNPLKFAPSLQTALNHLFFKPWPEALSPQESIAQAFNDLHSHHLGILAGARAVTAALLNKLAPAKVQERLETTGSFKLNKEVKLWKTYTKLHVEISESEALADFFSRDFARAYERQVRLLKPVKSGPREG
ncbi:MAG: type VI secretion system-associated FHA domain protein TagH [Deltaproteobacteria bacterium]|jgi:type VI secretion system protein ImpI|nr:type VI secretion system-associated FHA domain protein TagH [Deltaproteobacteria bacterium]